jgi:hypothetical protein
MAARGDVLSRGVPRLTGHTLEYLPLTDKELW